MHPTLPHPYNFSPLAEALDNLQRRMPKPGTQQYAELQRRMEAIRVEALTMRGTGDLPDDCGRDPWTGLWNNAPRGER